MRKIKKNTIVAIAFIIILVPLSALGIYKYFEYQKQFCSFEYSNITMNQYHFDKTSEIKQKINELEQKIESSNSTGKTWDEIFLKSYERELEESNLTYFEVEGLIKNIKKSDQFLDSIHLKVYSGDGNKVLLTKTAKEVEIMLTKNQSVPFKISAKLNRKSDIAIEYYENNGDVVYDFYPYFTTCE